MKKYLSILIAVLMAFSSCAKEELATNGGMTEEQRSLIGRAVNFNTSIIERYSTKTSWNNGGGFNDGDFLIVYREYLDGTNNTFGEMAYRVYHRYQEYIPGTNYTIGDPTWKPLAGKTGFNSLEHPDETFKQAESDSLTWDNGRTVRYRAVGRSNFAGSIGNATSSNKGSYYPDYTYCEWVTASGPTNDVAFTMKHLGARLIFTAKDGNVIKNVELTTDWKDYKYKDNSDTNEKDKGESEISDDEAKSMANAVAAVYNQMCLPAGVDVETGMLKAMTSAFYTSSTNFYDLDTKTRADGIIFYGEKTPDYIASEAQRPVFNQVHTNQFYLITNPYTISSTESGKQLVLPSFTRFRVYVYDVNSGDDSTSSPEWEKAYHILALSDVTDGTTQNKAFPDGLELSAGDSYTFQIGYYYDKFTVSIENSGLSWNEQTALSGDATSASVAKPAGSDYDYSWWINGVKLENPAFTIADATDFLEFIRLVNGTATSVTEDLKQEYRTIKRPNGTVDDTNTGYWWYTMDGDKQEWHGKVGTTSPFSSGTIPDEYSDHIFYQHYVFKDGSAEKELRWDYLHGPFSFCDEVAMKPYTVSLSANLDLHDWIIPAIGYGSGSTPFRGVLDGCGHLISNVNVTGGYLFERIKRSEIRNLRLESLHNTSLLREGTDANYIIGVSIDAPCTGSSMAASLTGTVDGQVNTSYIVGCIHVGKADAAMVGASDALVMLGCMEAGSGITSGTPALLGAYAGMDTRHFFDPQGLAVTRWDDFMCNYFDTQLSPGTLATPGKGTLAYSPQEYIRGLKTSLLMARQDYFISDRTPYEYLKDYQRLAFYGLAPYKAMNYAIWKYNSSEIGRRHTCDMRFTIDATGFDYHYPTLVTGAPILTEAQQKSWNVLNQNN